MSDQTDNDDGDVRDPRNPWVDEIGELVRQGRFCEAARLYSDWSGHDYLESKLAIDQLARKHGLAPHRGCASYFMMLAIGAGAGLYQAIAWWNGPLGF